MFKIYIKILIKDILNNKVYSFLNIFGLVLGLSAFLYIIAYVSYETNYDNFHTKADRTFRCVCFAKMGETVDNIPRSEVPLAAAIKNDLPEVEAATRLYVLPNIYTQYKKQKFIETEIWFADANIFDVFDFNIIEGNKATALSKPNSILITLKTAKKYFGNENPLGKSIILGNNKVNYEVTGVLDNLPSNSHLQFDFLASFSSLAIHKNNQWLNLGNTYTYIVTKKGIDIEKFGQKFNTCMNKYEEPVIKLLFGSSLDEFKKQGNFINRELQPLQKIHLNSTFPEESETYGNPRFLIILGIVGFLILIIALSNFINLSTVRASYRTKEIGMKMVLGSTRKNIAFQIFYETFIYSILALIISIVFLIVALPLLNKYPGIIITPDFFLNKDVLLTIIFIPILTTILAGSYLAFVIARFKLIDIVKGKSYTNKQNPWVKTGLVLLQFIIFIVLIFSTIIINRQIVDLRSRYPGFEKENVLVVKNMYYLGNQAISFKGELNNEPSIVSTSFSSTLPSIEHFAGNAFGARGSDKKHFMTHIKVDPDFQKTLNAIMLDGRFFTDSLNSEGNNAVINEEAAKMLGWSNSKDKYIYDYSDMEDFKVIGIINNFHMKSLREKSVPLVIRLTETSNYLSIRLYPGNTVKTLNTVKKKWEKFNSDAPFEYFFLDESFYAQYKSEERLALLIGAFTMIAILIACFGLFGLISYTTMQKTKEIGIRKVNGATVYEIVHMLNKDYIIWVAIAFVIASPIAYYAMSKWLQNFAYKTELSWWIFALAGVMALLIALITVSWQSFKAARKNPVEALRYE
ncbi:MAG: ABC transporter permease [Bacteroidota bacterium]